MVVGGAAINESDSQRLATIVLIIPGPLRNLKLPQLCVKKRFLVEVHSDTQRDFYDLAGLLSSALTTCAVGRVNSHVLTVSTNEATTDDSEVNSQRPIKHGVDANNSSPALGIQFVGAMIHL